MDRAAEYQDLLNRADLSFRLLGAFPDNNVGYQFPQLVSYKYPN
jgi:hypothetical protein